MGPGEGWTVVTGGTGGLGIGVVRRLVGAGHRVLVTWIVDRELETFPDDLRRVVRLERLDVGSAEQVDALATALRADGGVWALVHLVGGYLDGAPVAGMDLEGWDRQVELNLRTAAVTLRGFLGGMSAGGGGRVVAVGTRAAIRPFAGAAAYAASKAGVVALVQAASEEVKGDGVCVNAVLPSVIDTPGNRAAQPEADHSRWVRPEEIGAVIAFLCSSDASAVTGAAIPRVPALGQVRQRIPLLGPRRVARAEGPSQDRQPGARR